MRTITANAFAGDLGMAPRKETQTRGNRRHTWGMTNKGPRACPPIVYGLALKTPPGVVAQVTAALARHHQRIKSRWRAHELTEQAVLTCAFLEGGHTYRALAAGNEIPRSTCHRYIQEGIKVLARRALPLTEVVRLAARAGWDYLIVDGVNIPTERIAAQFTKKQHWYSGKHKCHGAAVQTVAAPDGELLWVSGVLPGKTVDITAARRFKIAEKVLAFLGLLADLGYIGLHPDVITGYKRTRGEKALSPSKKAANQAQASLRAIGERANAQLKCWKVLTGDFRGRPRQITAIVKAIQTLQHMIRDPFGTANIVAAS